MTFTKRVMVAAFTMTLTFVVAVVVSAGVLTGRMGNRESVAQRIRGTAGWSGWRFG